MDMTDRYIHWLPTIFDVQNSNWIPGNIKYAGPLFAGFFFVMGVFQILKVLRTGRYFTNGEKAEKYPKLNTLGGVTIGAGAILCSLAVLQLDGGYFLIGLIAMILTPLLFWDGSSKIEFF